MALLFSLDKLIKYVHVMDRPYCTEAYAWLDPNSTKQTMIRRWTYITPRVSDVRELFEIYTHDHTALIQRIELRVYPHAWSSRRWDEHIIEAVVLRSELCPVKHSM